MFSTQDDFVQHSASERGKEIPCDVCGHMVTRISELRKHMAHHTEERKHKCLQCGASYKLLSSLSRHTRENHEYN